LHGPAALLQSHLHRQGADRLLQQPPRRAAGRHRRDPHGSARLRDRRWARRRCRRAADPDAARGVRLRCRHRHQRLRRRHLRRAAAARRGADRRAGAGRGGGAGLGLYGLRVAAERRRPGPDPGDHDLPGRPAPRRRGMTTLRAPGLGFWLGAAVALGTLLLPLLLYDAELTIYVFIGLAIIVVAGLNLLYGFAGQVSLGQGAFYAIGAYCAGILARRGIPPLAALLLAPVLTAAVAVVVGLPVLRLRGHYLSFATLAFQLIVLSIAGQFRELTGGDPGLTGIPDLL